MDLEKRGAYPQKRESDAPGVSLTRPERTFLAALTDPFAESTDADLNQLGQLAKLREADVSFIREWVLCHGVHWLTCENAGVDFGEGSKIFRNPIVRRVINAAAEQGLCLGTSAMKDEIEDYFTQRIRNPFLPEAIRDNAADKLAKLKGYYPDAKDKSGGAQIQINFVNPYAQPEVACETD
jgi:hypothetical protein